MIRPAFYAILLFDQDGYHSSVTSPTEVRDVSLPQDFRTELATVDHRKDES